MIANGEITADQAKMGYVGAYTYAEVLSGYTSFYLGAKSVCPSVTMDVTFTGSWYDESAEREAANNLINGGCVLISQHADSMGAPSACEAAGVPNVSYNGSTAANCPETYLVSSRIDWTPYYVYAINCVINGEAIDADWTGTLETGSVVLTELGENVAEGTQEAIDEAHGRPARTAACTSSTPAPSPSRARPSPASWPTSTPTRTTRATPRPSTTATSPRASSAPPRTSPCR